VEVEKGVCGGSRFFALLGSKKKKKKKKRNKIWMDVLFVLVVLFIDRVHFS
jgi:hypothetical protein